MVLHNEKNELVPFLTDPYPLRTSILGAYYSWKIGRIYMADIWQILQEKRPLLHREDLSFISLYLLCAGARCFWKERSYRKFSFSCIPLSQCRSNRKDSSRSNRIILVINVRGFFKFRTQINIFERPKMLMVFCEENYPFRFYFAVVINQILLKKSSSL